MDRGGVDGAGRGGDADRGLPPVARHPRRGRGPDGRVSLAREPGRLRNEPRDGAARSGERRGHRIGMTNLPPGSRIGRFEISGVLGEGAMGVVYLAHDPQIERPVAIKTLRSSAAGSSTGELESRFLKEAKLA